MSKIFLKISVLIASGSILFSSCSKDENDSSSINPTNGKTTAVFNSNVTYGTITDQDGNIYKTVTIGTQIWMAENLRTTKYNDGIAIPLVTDGTTWRNLSTGGYCNYDNITNIDTVATYGRLYNWYAVNTNKLAPIGWHVPTDTEWEILTYYLNGELVAGGKLKETGIVHWISPNAGATNETGFTALSGGYRLAINGMFDSIGESNHWWSVTEGSDSTAWYRGVYYLGNDVYRYAHYKQSGFSVRCLRD
jgi:uncharacterized protein (TIGR02145 family)